MLAHPYLERLKAVDPVLRSGRVRSIHPTAIEGDGPAVPLGTLCRISARHGWHDVLAEVVRIDRGGVTLAPFSDTAATFSGAAITASADAATVAVGDALAGRAVNALGRPLDGRPLHATERRPLHAAAASPLERGPPTRRLHTGIRAIDSLLPLSRGQRMGIFAASGVGKTSLVNLLAQNVEADRCVVCLVGERGREVASLWQDGLSPETRARTTLVAATSDESAAMRVRAGNYALSLAEHWRSQGHDVLLVLDSVTRLAMAMREIGLAAGEPPTIRAYTPNVFAAIPRLVERCGALNAGGSITAVMTVLSETDAIDDPISEMMKSLLDGHILLSRALGEQGHFPAIDVLRSISRRAETLMEPRQRGDAVQARTLLAAYEEARTLIEAGLYVPGSSGAIDAAIRHRPALLRFLRQAEDERSTHAESCAMLARAVKDAG